MLRPTPILILTLFALLPTSATKCLAQTKSIEVPEKIMAQRLLDVVKPAMPEGAFKQKCSNALVMLKITIDESGKVSGAEFVSGFEEFKDSSLAAISGWTYKPYEQNGKPVIVSTKVSIFYLGDGQAFPMYAPDGKGGVKGGNLMPLPQGCGSDIMIKRDPH